VTNNVFFDKNIKTQQNNKSNIKILAGAGIEPAAYNYMVKV